MSTQPQLSPLEQLGAMGQPQTTTPSQPQDQSSNLSPLEQLGQSVQKAQTAGPSPEEQQLLASNPSYKYLPKDPRFPNRQPGVYPMGEGNEWRDDPNSPMASNSQSPIDPHLLKHTAEGAGYGALAAGSALAAPLASPVVDAAITHLGSLTKIVQAAKNLGWTTFGIKEAHDLYKMVAGDSKK